MSQPEQIARNVDKLLVFDARHFDVQSRQELLRFLPQLVHVRRARKAIFLRRGCSICRRKNVGYGAGGFCNRCAGRDYLRVKAELRKMGRERDPEAETLALTRRLDLAQWLLNGE